MNNYYGWKVPKILVLGYKSVGRGKQYRPKHKDLDVEELLGLDAVILFDDLAVEQLNVRTYTSDDDWNKYYAGRDGEYTMYIDLVEMKYARSSTSKKRYDIKSIYDVPEMFSQVRRYAKTPNKKRG